MKIARLFSPRSRRAADPALDRTAPPNPDEMTMPPPLSRDDITRIAKEVSLLMQLDRTRHQVATQVDMAALANVPAYITSVFEEAGAVGSQLSNEDLYRQVNKRVAQAEAQIYLLRLEMENRHERDPARIYEDPLVIAAYGERLETLTGRARSFGFDSAVLAYGWYPAEYSEGRAHRWMRPGDVSVACVPHLGTVDQVIEIRGHVLEPAQLDGLAIRAGAVDAAIIPDAGAPARFTAQLELEAEAAASANYLPVEFTLTDFRQPNAQDVRMLGANISRFTCRPATVVAQGPAQDTT